MNTNGVRYAALCLVLLATACVKEGAPPAQTPARMSVVATLFAVFDLSRAIAGEKAVVTMLVPPGMEAHSFEPRPSDIVALSNASVFVYTNDAMEPWAGGLLKGVGNNGMVVIDASKGVRLMPGGGHDGEGRGVDPHFWMDFSNAQVMADTIAAGMAKKDPANKDYYLNNAATLKAKLAALDGRYTASLKSCRTRVFAHGGHFAFGYLARRYGLQYLSAFDFSPDAEPSPARMAELVKLARKHKLKAVFYEELVNPRVAATIGRETGAELLGIQSAHDVTVDDFHKGVTFVSMMEGNLEKFKRGLECTP